MSGAQGAQPPGETTATTYESMARDQEEKPRLDLHSREDERGIQIDKLQDKVPDAAGKGGPVFGAGADVDVDAGPDKKPDLGVTGTA